jgi:SAM-dependent methyltransferase
VTRALARPGVQLVLTSATVLYAELLLLRWIPANVVYIGFFSNFILMASFLGIGLGILVGRALHPTVSPFPVLLALVVGVILHEKLELQFKSGNDIFFGLAESHAADANFIVLPIVFVLVVVVLSAVALPLGGLLRSQPPLRAYALDIAGSIVGIVAFSVLAALSLPPSVWFAGLAVLVVALELRRAARWPAALNALVMVGIIYAAASYGHPGEVWSPYYRIYVQQVDGSDANIYVNGIPHQAMHAVSVDATQPEVFYDQVYDRFPGRVFGHALIVGAGSGTDVAYAIAHGVTAIDAVEIDPKILEIGALRHPDRPYDDPRVHTHINDGRAYLRSDGTRYDLIIFALPDSLTLVSTTANLRLESYLFTEEAFASARDHLTPDGVFVLYNYYRQPWLLDKIAAMLADVFGARPAISEFNVGIGSAAVLMAGPAIGGTGGSATPVAAAPAPATDDWPFLYLRERGIDPAYIAALAFVLFASVSGTVLVARRTRTPVAAFSPHFFVLGTAFLLLETRSLATFGLLFGTTWLVNALVFLAILVSVLLAIFVNARSRPRRGPLYVALGAALGVAFLLPPSALLVDPPWLRYGLSAVVAFAPVFFANLVFTRSFQDTRSADMAFASNLIGATLGGVLEYSALITGYRGLLLVVAALYLAAFVLGSRVRVLGDRPAGDGTPSAPILAV